MVALILAGGFIDWVFWAMREAAIQTGLGHIQIVRPGYKDSGTADPFSFLLPEKSSEFSALQATPGVKAISTRLSFSGLISSGETTLSFVGEGVDPESERIVSGILPIVQGENLAAQDSSGIILGEGLAANLGIKVGDTAILLTSSASGGVNAVEAHVRGIFSTQVKAFDASAVRVPIVLSQKLLRVVGAHTWVVSLSQTDNTERLVERLRSQFQGAALQFLPWYELADFYNKSKVLLSRQLDVVRLIIALIIVLSISNTLIMSVLERTGEIGTLMAMGTTRAKVLRMFFIEGLILGIAGGALGLAVGSGLAYIVSTIGIPMPPPPGRSVGYSGEILVTFPLIEGAMLLAVVTTGLASVYPSWKASRLVIVDALRHNR